MLVKLLSLLPTSVLLHILIALQKFICKLSASGKANNLDTEALRKCDEWNRKVDDVLWAAQLHDMYDPHK